MFQSPIEIGLFAHPKLHQLMDKLGHERSATCIGYLALLWGYAMHNEIPGNASLPDMADLTWARVFDVDKAQGLAIRDAMIEARFLDHRDGRYWIHNWAKRGGKFIDKMLADRERKVAARLRHVHGASTDGPRSGEVKPNQRKGNQTKPNQTVSNDAPAQPRRDAWTVAEEFWGLLPSPKVYPAKGGSRPPQTVKFWFEGHEDSWDSALKLAADFADVVKAHPQWSYQTVPKPITMLDDGWTRESIEGRARPLAQNREDQTSMPLPGNIPAPPKPPPVQPWERWWDETPKGELVKSIAAEFGNHPPQFHAELAAKTSAEIRAEGRHGSWRMAADVYKSQTLEQKRA
jgi:hypothetical protein